MSAIEIVHTLAESEEREGIYIVTYNKARWFAYIRDKSELESLGNQEELDDDLLKARGIYLLKNIREVFYNSEERTRKLIKYLMASDEAMNSEAMKIFIIMLTAYLVYQEIYSKAIVEDPTTLDFFKASNDDNSKNIKLELLQNIFYYLVEYKGLLAKLNIHEKYAEIAVSFEELDKNKSIFSKDIIDPQLIISLFNTIRRNFEISEEPKKGQ
jgi:hypothetical protein